MANRPRPDNPARSVRIEDALWEQVVQRAETEEEGVTVSDVVRAALTAYLRRF